MREGGKIGSGLRHKEGHLSEGSRCTIFLHRAVMALRTGDGKTVDHVNGDGLDCKRANLRIVTRRENTRNRGGSQTNGSSGFLGVTLNRSGWMAHIMVDGKTKNLGRFRTPEEANLARLTYEKNIWGIQPRRQKAFQEAGLSQ